MKEKKSKAKLSPQNRLEIIRHSTAHVLAAAVLEMFPEAKFGIGPAIENGFYYDFELPRALIPEDLEIIEEKMKKIIQANFPFEKKVVPIEKAQKKFQDANQTYKAELIAELKKENNSKVTLYKSGHFVDLCSGPHLESTGEIPLEGFKLTKISGAYWRGDNTKPQLQRIYGVVFENKKELKKHLLMLEEAKKRDHRKLGKELELFTIPSESVGPGLVIWLPKGAVIRNEIEKLIKKEQTLRGYQYIYTPHIGKKDLWVKSGHWDLYSDKMYAPMKIDENEYLIKPMNCPMHIEVYRHKKRSYRDLPFKIAEVATVYRYEQPGELSGLARVRYITQDDAHIFCRKDQIVEEFIQVVDYIEFLYGIFGFKDYEMWLTLRDPNKKNKYLGSDEIWNTAEKAVATALKKKGYDYIPAEGEAKFYGPSLDIMIKDSLGRKWQCATVQVDFMLPEKFGLTYVDKNGQEKTPIMLHRAPLGSLERFISLLIEHYAGAFPVWLSPIQAKIIPVSEKFLKYALKIHQLFLKNEIRSEINDGKESLGKRIAESSKQKIPYLLIVGEKEEKTETISVRQRGKEKKQFSIKIDDFIKRIQKEIKERK